jgi:hypothetical protein
MIPQQAMSNDPLSPHTLADADATVTGTDMVYLAGLQPQPVEWLWQHRLAAGTSAIISGEPGSGKTWVALATLRRAKFDIGVRSSNDGKSGAWWWTLPHPEDEYPPVKQARSLCWEAACPPGMQRRLTLFPCSIQSRAGSWAT